MKVKNLNPLERHVEKIVVGVAALGACYLLYQGIMEPTTITYTHKDVGPDKVEHVTTKEIGTEQVEREVSSAVDVMQRKADEIARKTDSELFSNKREFVPEYLRIHDKPLDPKLLTTNIPRFGPIQAPVKAGAAEDTPRTAVVASPAVPALQNSALKPDRGLVLIPQAPATGAAAGAAPVMLPHDLNWVVLTGDFSILDFRASMNNIGGTEKDVVPIPGPFQRITFHKVEVQRRERAAGVWGDWSDVPATKAAPLEFPKIDLTGLSDANIAPALDQLDKDWKNRIFPSFYTKVGGGAVLPPLTPTVLTPQQKADIAAKLAEIAKASKTGAPAFGVPEAALNPAQLAGAAVTTTDLSVVRNQATIPVWFFDETVEAEHTYQYRWRISMFNPVYHIANVFGLKMEGLRSQQWIASEWALVAADAQIQPNLSFFFSQPGVKNPRQAIVTIYKWYQGSWYPADEQLDPGMTIGGEHKTPVGNVDFSTHYTLVDSSQDGSDWKIVLMSPQGELITRSVNADNKSPIREDLLKQSQMKKLPTPAGTGTPGGTGMPVPKTPS